MDDSLSELHARLYLDQDVRVQLAGMLRAEGLDAITTLEAGRLGERDQSQLEFAVSQQRAMLTHNRLDFERLHVEWLSSDRPHYGILIAVQRRDFSVTRERIIDLVNRLDGDQLRSGLFYV